jgi:phospholipid/cholesterol/gamma-HCH transport system ATP-binding protein
MEQLEIAEFGDKYPSELSGGMQKRAALARALVTDPKIILFDEPTTGQDPIRKNAILSMIAQNQKRFGFTTIMISHEIPDVFFISNRILILYDGKIVFQGTYQELDKLDHPMVDEYIRSLQSFEEEFMGADAGGAGLRAFGAEAKGRAKTETITVAIFTLDEFEALSEKHGRGRADEIMLSLGEHVNRHFGNLGISYQVAKNEFIAILNQTDEDSSKEIMEGFALDVREQGLAGIHADTGKDSGSEKSLCFMVRAGLFEGHSRDDTQITTDKARSKQEEIARFSC